MERIINIIGSGLIAVVVGAIALNIVQDPMSARRAYLKQALADIKATGDGKGNTVNEVYVLSGGTFKIIPGGKSNMDGNVESSVTVYELWFRNDARLLT